MKTKGTLTEWYHFTRFASFLQLDRFFFCLTDFIVLSVSKVIGIVFTLALEEIRYVFHKVLTVLTF